jgi:uncharacterized protein YbbK (DUF523 family)
MSDTLPRVGVSSCLLGELVRYDGKEKRISWITDVLAQKVELISICPEVGAGMPVPRPAIQIVEDSGRSLRLQVVSDGRDVTAPMHSFMAEQIRVLTAQPIDGYIFKARSPSCGLRDTPHFLSTATEPTRVASGLWAASVREHFPALPLADESDVLDESGQERFLKQVQAHWQARG